MDFQLLRSFLAIADELHFGRAAAAVHLSQPSLSQQLRRLERTVGVELVARTSHEVRLTAAGHAFRAEATRLIGQADRAVVAARDAAAGRTGQLSVGFNFSSADRLLRPALRRFGVSHPDVVTHLWEQSSGPQLKRLVSGELDVGFVFGPPNGACRSEHQARSDDGLCSREVLRVRVVAVVGDHHPWAGRERIAFSELASMPCLLCTRATSPTMHDTILAAARQTGTALRIDGEADDVGAAWLRLSTSAVAGIASLERARSMSGMVPVPIVDPVLTLAVHAVWRPPLSAHVTALLDHVDSVRDIDGRRADVAGRSMSA